MSFQHIQNKMKELLLKEDNLDKVRQNLDKNNLILIT